ncbi:hypothetical protein Kfla_2245 [Kribbella flavida DSM 17836]|uniref:Uncharacterized protein n=1 Tax=Kribbella flavida (strain DSM 17836 / JCM 10339 / NBRC 14399) TaxID=479435 RepID=D2PTK8_KRIFD|nr:hypothetical protein [Kribbella flavida]ADB31321.1 hypothetical protein Kfla_2245 [Kribbella flavida DSM 17836]
MTHLDHRNPAADLANAAGTAFAPSPRPPATSPGTSTATPAEQAAEQAADRIVGRSTVPLPQVAIGRSSGPDVLIGAPAGSDRAVDTGAGVRLGAAPFDGLLDTTPSRHVAAAHATTYALAEETDYYPLADAVRPTGGHRASRSARTSSAVPSRGRRADRSGDGAGHGTAGNGGNGGRRGRGTGGGTGGGRKRSSAVIGAAVVASTAILGTFGFILSNGTTPDPQAGSGTVRDTATSAPPSTEPAPALPSTAKADRKPAVTPSASSAPPNTGPESPKFRRGQWIAVLDTYPTDAGMAADQLAKDLAGQLIKAGVPAKALLATGQYPGLTTSDLRPVSDAWIVYIGPATSSEAAINLCVSPKIQRIHANNACPTYEPASAAG